MSLRSSPHHHTILLFVIMLAQPGIQGSEGMDTGFRRYDGIHPIRRVKETRR
jgi:hypothetical protein